MNILIDLCLLHYIQIILFIDSKCYQYNHNNRDSLQC